MKTHANRDVCTEKPGLPPEARSGKHAGKKKIRLNPPDVRVARGGGRWVTQIASPSREDRLTETTSQRIHPSYTYRGKNNVKEIR